MTVQSDLQSAIASCESAKGTFAMMAQSTEDEQVKQKFKQMVTEVDGHVQFLSGRLDYVNENNLLNN